DAAMAAIGFRRKGNQYVHPRARYLVEFPSGPLGIGADLDIRPVTFRIGRVGVKTLSPTDSCRDRLAAFYHWNDRQGLAVAGEIARRRKVNVGKILEWSRREGAANKSRAFLDALTGPVPVPRPRPAGRPSNKDGRAARRRRP